MTTGTVQNVNGTSVPIQALNPPPEGQQGVQIGYTFSPSGVLTQSQILQLNQPGGLALSQVVSLVIDNSQNTNAIIIQHGVFDESVAVPAGGVQVVPTFSTKSFFNISLTLPQAPLINTTVNIIFLNYARQQYNVTSGSQVTNNNQQAATVDSLNLNNSGQLQMLTNLVPGSYPILQGFSVNAANLETASQAEVLAQIWGTDATGATVDHPFWTGAIQFGSTYGKVAFVELGNMSGLAIPARLGGGLAAVVTSSGLTITHPPTPVITFNAYYITVTP